MKIRNCHVSNSSSSSFIIGIAWVPSDKIAEAEKLDGSLYDFERITSTRMWDAHYCPQDDKLFVSAFNGQDVTIGDICKRFEQDPTGAVLVLDQSGYSPDWDSDYGSYNYDDVNESTDWFDESYLRTAGMIRKLGGEVLVGAGYNG